MELTKKHIIIIGIVFILGISIGLSIVILLNKSEKIPIPYVNHYTPPKKEFLDWEPVDENGIVMFDYKGDIGFQYNPVIICQCALGDFSAYIQSGEKHNKKRFLKHADWLVENQVITPKKFGVWYYNFNFTKFNCYAPWVSAMAQGQIISVLTRAHFLTNKKIYLEKAELAIGAFEHPIEDMGVLYTDKEGNTFYLEYACDPPPLVLNGFITSLIGLYELHQTTASEKAKKLFEEGIHTLKTILADYDTGEWSLYCLNPKKEAKRRYHRLHCRQLFVLYSFTRDPFFLDYAEKWFSYMQP
jgi:hypothetical protein